MSIAALLASLSLVLWIAPSALAAGSIVDPDDELCHEDYAGVGLVVGSGILLLASSVMARVERLTSTSFWLAGGVLAVLAITILAGRGRSTASDRSGAEVASLVALPFVVALIAFSPHLSSIAMRPDALPGSTPWYYWDLAAQTAAASGFPETSAEWATEVSFLDDYPGFTAVTAGVAMASAAPDLVFAAHLVRIFAAIGSGFGIWYLSRVFGASRYGAALSVLLLAALEIFAIKLLSYRPEAAGYALMFIAPALAKRWLDDGRPVFVIAASVGLASLGLIHGVTWTIAAILIIAISIALPIFAQDRRTVLTRVLVLLLTVFGLWAITSFAIQGRITEAEKLAAAPEITETGIDPTWEFSASVSGSTGTPPPTADEMVSRVLGRGFVAVPTWAFWSAAALGAILLITAAWRGDMGARQLLVTVALFALGVSLIAGFFAVGWDTYVPKRTGFVRLIQVSVFMIPIGVGVGMSRLRLLRSRGATTILLAAGVALLGLVAGDITASALDQMPPRSSLSEQRSLDLSGQVLFNGYTEGYFATNLGVNGVLEGRAPYTNAELLNRANSSLKDAMSFFVDPLAFNFEAAPYDYVIASTRPWVMGNAEPFPVNLPGLRQSPDLRVIAENPDWVVLERIDE